MEEENKQTPQAQYNEEQAPVLAADDAPVGAVPSAPVNHAPAPAAEPAQPQPQAAPAPSQKQEAKTPPSPALPKPGSKKELSLIGQEISGCVILEKISEGGMGTVFKAKHKALDRVVCVKVLSPSLANDKKAVGLFLTEARAIAEIDHPNIVFVYNVGKEKGFYFIVMTFIEGESLSSIVRKKPNLPISFVVETFIGILRGLEAAHAKGIIHRDIKPSNILINKKLEPKIVDFGIAKKVDKEKGFTKTTELAGTAYFLSPEQALGRSIDTRADLYSVGASLFYVLTSKYPFTGKNSMDIIQKHINEPVPEVSAIRKGVPPWLSNAIAKLMSKDPNDRFQTATDTLMFFQKMRADDQLKVGKGVNIADEVGLKISSDDVGSSPRLEEQRIARQNRFNLAAAEQSMRSTGHYNIPVMAIGGDPGGNDGPHTKTNLPSVMDPRKPEKNITENFLDARDKQVTILGGKPAKPARPVLEDGLKKENFFIKSFLMTALATAMMVVSTVLFYKLGAICSLFDIGNQRGLDALIAPWTSGQFVAGQMVFASIGFVFIIFTLSMLFFNLINRIVPVVLCLAVWSYIMGFFRIYVPGVEINLLSSSLLPLYAFVLASLAIRIDDIDVFPTPWRGVSIICFGAAFYALHIFLKTQLFIHGDLTTPIFYSCIGLIAATFVLPLLRGSTIFRMATALVFVTACVSIWLYHASGNVYYTMRHIRIDTKEAKPLSAVEPPMFEAYLPKNYKVSNFQNTQFDYSEDYAQPAAPSYEAPASAHAPEEESAEAMPPAPLTPGEKRAEFIKSVNSTKDLTIEEAQKRVWIFAIKEPIDIFLYSYRGDGFGAVSIAAIILYGVLMFIVTIFAAREEKWTLT